MTKLANIWFTQELSRRLQGSGVSVFSVHPGVVSTDLGRYIGGERSHGLNDTNTWFSALVPEFVSGLVAKMSSLVTISPAMGARYESIKGVFRVKCSSSDARTSLFCALEADLETGRYWDNCRWSECAQMTHIGSLNVI